MQGAATGGAVGSDVGIAGVPLTGPVSAVLGALVGAHIGSLIGGLSKTKEKGEKEEGEENKSNIRQSGMVVAVSVNSADKENAAITLLLKLGANQIERAECNITDGNWQDFDPLKSPELNKASMQT